MYMRVGASSYKNTTRFGFFWEGLFISYSTMLYKLRIKSYFFLHQSLKLEPVHGFHQGFMNLSSNILLDMMCCTQQ